MFLKTIDAAMTPNQDQMLFLCIISFNKNCIYVLFWSE